jgi:hypothetical protein
LCRKRGGAQHQRREGEKNAANPGAMHEQLLAREELHVASDDATQSAFRELWWSSAENGARGGSPGLPVRDLVCPRIPGQGKESIR